ncbi:hypothetical protein M407DRAFT_112998 [Tulasnella calospora MUT 4182]|uniref:Uncharacterized protein n=1 Tax=Tulasnella calospora MUT 4182 TaxID=1051891 RepID=A0A0C3Q387_9AGAM|nr:hypothetical protein M407DRAFT_112998 [Tulasnella calospora MUT 4182]
MNELIPLSPASFAEPCSNFLWSIQPKGPLTDDRAFGPRPRHPPVVQRLSCMSSKPIKTSQVSCAIGDYELDGLEALDISPHYKLGE